MCKFIPTADIADIIGDRVQSCDVQFRNFGGKTDFCGRITTIRSFQDNGLVKEVLNTPNKGGVLVVDGMGSLHTALMGDMIAEAAQENGWAGVIIFGAIRDSRQVGKMDLGCKALGTNPRKSAKKKIGEVDVPVSFGGVEFIPGYVVFADDDGVVVTPEPIDP